MYLDGTHSAWQSVGTMTQRLLEADVQDAQGFFLNVSNYQPTPELIDYGTWISDCIAMVTDSANAYFNNPSACASQYYPATQSDFSTWGLTTAVVRAEHGQRGRHHALRHRHQPQRRRPEQHAAVRQRAVQPAGQRDQHARVRELVQPARLRARACGRPRTPAFRCSTPTCGSRPPASPTASATAAGGVRAWDYTDYTQPSWPTTAAAQALFDPLWGIDDPAAGAWFPQQALQLAQ